MNTITQKITACNRDCPDACGIVATIENGRITRLQGDPQHPVTQGYLCHRTSRFLERQYSSDRLLTPLARDGNDFRPISWNEALDQIAEQMLRFRTESGGASILHYRCGGSLGIMKHVSDYFFERFGPVTVKSGDICSGAGEAAQATDFGQVDSNDLFDVQHSSTIVLWGKNVYVSSIHLIPILREAQQNGTQIVLIDPVHHQTNQIADLYIQPRAGGDAALACGVARWLFTQHLIDPVSPSYCDHFEAYQNLVFSKSHQDWSQAAGVTARDLQALSEVYAHSPAAILLGWGMQRRRFGAATVRAIDALATVSGNIGIPGGGASYYFQRRGAFDFSFSDPDSAPRKIPEPLIGPGILAQTDPPIRMVWVTAANPVAMLPESKTVAHALESRELTVVVDSFLTDTARHADIVLPTTTMLEEDDLLGAYGHHWLTAMKAVTDPPAGVKSDYAIIQELAQRVGLGDEFNHDVTVWQKRLLARLAEHGITLDQVKAGAIKNPLAKSVIFADRKFATPTGKVNLIHELPEALTHNNGTSRLTLAALSTQATQSSQSQPHEQEGPAQATVHPTAAPEFQDGQLAILVSEQGELTVQIKFNQLQRPDVVLMDKGGWLHSGRCANALIKAEVTDAGGCAVYYDTPVTLKPMGQVSASSDQPHETPRT
ncbi:MAG: molybdopterin-dependent oxidoreductase [Pirellulaceae bacterium]|nr:molybdopterin-dependent oxidoreductase [Pirellulaceae bacterium]